MDAADEVRDGKAARPSPLIHVFDRRGPGLVKRKMYWSLVFPAVARLLLAGASSPAAALSTQATPHGLYVPASVAPSVDRIRENGIHDLVYEVDESYPAPRFIGALQDALRTGGWSVPTIDPLNPEQGPSVVERNWARWTDTGRPSAVEKMFVRDWQCEWLSSQGQLVRYVLRYRRASPADSWSRMEVVAVYWPSEVLAAEQARLKTSPRQ